MRVAFVGAQGVGKTTLIESLMNDHPQYVFHKEVVRQLMKDYNIKINEHADNYDYSQTVITNAHLNNATISFFKDPDVFFDRCILDSIVFCRHLFNENKVSLETYKYSTSVLSLVFKYYPYDLLVYIPPMFDLVADGTRDTNVDFQKTIDTILHDQFMQLSTRFAAKFHKLESKSVTDRRAEINSLIKTTSGDHK
tara:strand:- start:1925 stop:2509 length:585 start_codon:yes stop_codon:yes gene_type:complete